MIQLQKGHQNDITPWQSTENDSQIPIFNNNYNLTRLQQKFKTQPTKHCKPNPNQKLRHILSNTKNIDRNIPIKALCNFQIPKRQCKFNKGKQILKQTRFKTVELDFTKFADIEQTAFFPNKQIKLQQTFPSYSLKKINRNATFYRHSGFKQILRQSGVRSIQNQQRQTEDNQPSELLKDLNITNSQIMLNSRSLTSKQSQQRNSQILSTQFTNNRIIMKNEEIFHKIIDSNKARKDVRFITGFNTKYVHNKHQDGNRMIASKSCAERGRRFDDLLQAIRHKQASSLKKDKSFLKGSNQEFVQLRINKCLYLPKIQLIEIVKNQRTD